MLKLKLIKILINRHLELLLLEIKIVPEQYYFLL